MLKLAWGVLLSQYGPETAAGEALAGGCCLGTGQQTVRCELHSIQPLLDCCPWPSGMQACRRCCRARLLRHAPTRATLVHPTCLALFPSARPCSLAERAGQLVGAATQAGALDFLKTGVLDSVPMQVGVDTRRCPHAMPC